MRTIAALLLILTLTGCAQLHMAAVKEEPVEIKPRVSLIEKIPPLDGPVVTVAVYGFADKTGQLKPNDKLAVFSKAVTQGAEVFLIKSLKDVPGWFRVVERVGLARVMPHITRVTCRLYACVMQSAILCSRSKFKSEDFLLCKAFLRKAPSNKLAL